MVNLHRWLKKTSPHLVIAGSLSDQRLVRVPQRSVHRG